jgi:hypothetical protein
MEQMQRKLQEEMREKQWEMQLRGQERMMRTQLSMQMAMARERMYWMGGAYCAALTGVLGAKLKGHAILLCHWQYLLFSWHTKQTLRGETKQKELTKCEERY